MAFWREGPDGITSGPGRVSEHVRKLRANERPEENEHRWAALSTTRAWQLCEQVHAATRRLQGHRGWNVKQQVAMRMAWVAHEPQPWNLTRYSRTSLARWAKQLRKKARGV